MLENNLANFKEGLSNAFILTPTRNCFFKKHDKAYFNIKEGENRGGNRQDRLKIRIIMQNNRLIPSG